MDLAHLPPASGIYQVCHAGSGKVYIGSSRNMRARLFKHVTDLNQGLHHSLLLQRAWVKHGPSAFAVTVIELCDVDQMLVREQAHLDLHKSWDPSVGYNVSPTAANCLGVKHTEATKQKLSVQRRGRPKSEEWKRKISAIHKGRIIPEAQREAIRAKLTGRKLSPERIANAVAGKLALIASGWKRPPLSPEVQARQAAKLRGRKMSDETRTRMSAARKGKAVPEEQRVAIAARMREIWRQRRAAKEVGT